ncbi:hypothetical protein [Nonomuraea sp. LPB2021202275-12-8]|uniref:hypothetical protein n=1 Tax=Nonomuraea sp. LPB2021202275-12-8 TaxID=3120159 RepID=UPI00300CC5E7
MAKSTGEPGVLFHEPNPEEAGLTLAQAAQASPRKPAARKARAATSDKAVGTTPQDRKVRARKIEHEVLSAVISFDTQWRLSLYCKITAYGVKDAVTKAAMGRLGIGLYPRPLRADVIRAAVKDTPFVEGDTTPRISVQMRDPDLMEQIRQDVAGLNSGLGEDDREFTMSSWTADALVAFFNHLRLPSHVSD